MNIITLICWRCSKLCKAFLPHKVNFWFWPFKWTLLLLLFFYFELNPIESCTSVGTFSPQQNSSCRRRKYFICCPLSERLRTNLNTTDTIEICEFILLPITELSTRIPPYHICLTDKRVSFLYARCDRKPCSRSWSFAYRICSWISVDKNEWKVNWPAGIPLQSRSLASPLVSATTTDIDWSESITKHSR